MKLLRIVGVALCAATTCAFADFSYEQTSKMTGGAAATAAKVMSVFSKKIQEPTRTTVLLKGDRMAHISASGIQVIDIGSETITDIDLQKKTYSVMTFAEMTQAMEKMMQRASEKEDPGADVKFKADVKETGQRKVIAGLDTRQVILTLEMQGTDRKSGDKGSLNVTSDMWIASNVPGYDEVKRFYERMAGKLAWTPGSRGMGPGDPGMGRALADLQKESAKLDGVPVLQIVQMGGAGEAQPAPEARPREEAPSPSITGALGRLGGLGGLGRRKRKEEAPAESTTPQGAPQPVSAVLMEITTEFSAFSTAAVDASRFEVPAGFRKVDNDLVKELRK